MSRSSLSVVLVAAAWSILSTACAAQVIDSTAISGQSASATAADTSAASADSATAAAVDTAIVSGEAATVTDTTGVSGEGVAAPERQSPPGTRPYKVEEVVVTASRLYAPLGETPAGVTVIDRREIEANSEKNLISLLSKKESVNPGSYGSFGALELISLRGARSGRTPVVLDGIVLNNAQNGDLDFNTIPATLLERIEIVRGPLGSIQGGNGVAGIVNLVTAEPERGDKPVSVVGTSSGDLAYRKHIATFARKLGRAGMLLGIEDAGSDGEPPYKSYVGRNYFGKLDYVFGKRSNVDVLMMSHSDDLKTLSGSTQKTKAKRVQVTGEQLLREKTRVRFGAFGSDEVTDYVEPFFNTVSDLERYGGLLDVAVDGTSLGDVVCGGGFVRNALSCKDPVTAWSPATREGYVFGGARIKAGEWLKSLVTLRMDFHSQFGNELSPYGSLYHERPNGMVWFSFGRGFNPPTMNDLFWPTQTVTFGEWSYVTSGNERLSGETIWMGELGSRFNFLGGFVRGGATCFASRTEDYIQWVSSVSFADQTVTFTPANTAQVDARGAELAVDFSRKGMPLVGANLTLQRVEDQTGAKLPYMPESRLNLWYSQSVEPFPELEVNLRVDATSVGKSVEPLGSSQGSFFLVEGKLSGTMAGFTAFARLRNATDAEYPSRSLRLLEEGQPARYYPMPGRNYEIGLLWKLLD